MYFTESLDHTAERTFLAVNSDMKWSDLSPLEQLHWMRTSYASLFYELNKSAGIEDDNVFRIIAENIAEAFSGGGGCVSGRDFDWDEKHAERVAISVAKSLGRSVKNFFKTPVAWRYRQMHWSVQGPITGWFYHDSALMPVLSEHHKYEVEPLYGVKDKDGTNDGK